MTDELKVLEATDAAMGREFSCPGGPIEISLEDHAGKTYTLQLKTPSGTWIDTDITFTDEGVKDFRSVSSRKVRYRLKTGGVAGAVAWVYGTGYLPGGLGA